tara:strand:- start:122 stop:394 length:273 start_codon:yes stop_codon:yes gene_type:complete
MTDNVNAPNHYLIKPGLEVMEVRESLLNKLDTEGIVVPAVDIDDWSRAWEYLTRAFFKNGAEDIEKSHYYIKRMVRRIKKRKEFNLDNYE